MWPQLVADKLNASCVNTARIAGGNQAIFRRTIVALQDLIDKNINPKEITILAQFSYWERHELIHSDFQFCGADFPYVSSKFIDRIDPLITNSKIIANIIKKWLVSVDNSYLYLVNLQYALMLHLWVEKIGAQMYSTFTELPIDLNTPEWATVGDNNIGLSNFDLAHKNVTKKNFELHTIADLDCYQPNLVNFVFDTHTSILVEMLMKYNVLNFDGTSNWIDFCTDNNFSYKKRMWEQGDEKFRPLDKIKKLVTGERVGNGHWGEDAHQAAAESIYKQIKEKE